MDDVQVELVELAEYNHVDQPSLGVCLAECYRMQLENWGGDMECLAVEHNTSDLKCQLKGTNATSPTSGTT